MDPLLNYQLEPASAPYDPVAGYCLGCCSRKRDPRYTQHFACEHLFTQLHIHINIYIYMYIYITYILPLFDMLTMFSLKTIDMILIYLL